jgi:predicted kinase
MLLLTIGISGSGKTTWSKEYCKNNPYVVRLSSDEFREIIGGSESNQNVNGAVFSTLERVTEYLLKNGHVVLLDATNYSVKNRANFIKIAKKLGVPVKAFYIHVPIEVAKQRNQERDRIVPDDVIERQFNNLVLPSQAEGINFTETIKNY